MINKKSDVQLNIGFFILHLPERGLKSTLQLAGSRTSFRILHYLFTISFIFTLNKISYIICCRWRFTERGRVYLGEIWG